MARARYAGDKIVGKSIVDFQGNFTVNVKKPSKAIQNSNKAFYQVKVEDNKTRWLKMTRRLDSISIKGKGSSKLTVTGLLGKAYANKSVQVRESYKCGGGKSFASIRINSKGDFKKTLVMQGDAKYVELLFVATNKKGFTTYSIPQLIRIK